MLHNLGLVDATAALAAAVPHHQITALLDRHALGDWGDLDADDKAANDEAARTGRWTPLLQLRHGRARHHLDHHKRHPQRGGRIHHHGALP
jgi:hypothetical protein